jgi:hypothetical protein
MTCSLAPVRPVGVSRALLAPRRLALAVAASLALVACDSDKPVDPTIRSVTLLPVTSEDAAAWVELLGAPVASVTVDEGEVFFLSRGDTTQVVLVRPDPGPLRFQVQVENAGETPVGTVIQVADGQNRLRDAGGYAAEVKP